MSNKFFFIFFYFLISSDAFSQDERYFKETLQGKWGENQSSEEQKKYSYYIHTPFYAHDLNSDGNPELIIYLKKDSEDWVEIFDQKNGIKKKIFSYQFETKGINAQLYKIEFKKISKNSSIFLMYFFEGKISYINLESSSRIYVGTIDNQDLKTISVMKGPSIFNEQGHFKGHYHLRNYQVYLKDLNDDGTKELVVKYHLMGQTFVYLGQGVWKNFNK